MTRIIYYSAKLDKEETESHGYPCGNVGLRGEVVSGGEEELQKRMEEIREENRRSLHGIQICSSLTGTVVRTETTPVKFVQVIRDYQEFEI